MPVMVDTGLGALQAAEVFAAKKHGCIVLCDAEHAPYGDKTPAFTIARGAEIVSYFYNWQREVCSASTTLPVVFACNSASVHAYERLRRDPWFSSPQEGRVMMGTIDPLVNAFSKNWDNLIMKEEYLSMSWYPHLLDKKSKGIQPHIVLFGTVSTIKSNVFQNIIRRKHPGATISAIACPNFATAIDNGISPKVLRSIVEERFSRIENPQGVTHYAGICTHYTGIINQFVIDRFHDIGNDSVIHLLQLPSMAHSYSGFVNENVTRHSRQEYVFNGSLFLTTGGDKKARKLTEIANQYFVHRQKATGWKSPFKGDVEFYSIDIPHNSELVEMIGRNDRTKPLKPMMDLAMEIGGLWRQQPPPRPSQFVLAA